MNPVYDNTMFFYTDVLSEQQKLIAALQYQLALANKEIENLRNEAANSNAAASTKQPRYWTDEEHQRFLEALKIYPNNDHKTISRYVGTRTAAQVRSHSQKYFLRLGKNSTKSQRNLDEISSVDHAGDQNLNYEESRDSKDRVSNSHEIPLAVANSGFVAPSNEASPTFGADELVGSPSSPLSLSTSNSNDDWLSSEAMYVAY